MHQSVQRGAEVIAERRLSREAGTGPKTAGEGVDEARRGQATIGARATTI